MRRYETLDALRGVAALSVVVYHLHASNLIPDLAAGAHLAVDFFFVLSGFVIAQAYGTARLEGLSFGAFASRRLVRLMPLAMAGALFGLAVEVIRWKLAAGHGDPLANILAAGALNVFLLPSFIHSSAYEHGMFPGDGPLWSLFFEMIVNLAWGWVGVRLNTRWLSVWVAVGAAALVALSIAHGSTRMGNGVATFWGGLARANFGFCAGVLLYRLRDRVNLPAGAWGPPAAVAALLVAFVAPYFVIQDATQALVWDLAWILVVLPAVVVLGAGQTRSGPLSRALGAISYPVYVLHWPFLTLVAGLRQKLGPRIDPAFLAVGAVVAVTIAAWLALKLYDEPVRGWLGRRLAGRPAARAVAAA